MDEHTKSSSGDSAFSWRAWPAREQPAKATLAGAIILAFGALITSWLVLDGVAPTLSVLAGTGALAVLFLALNRFFLPSRFEIDKSGLTAKYPLRGRSVRIEWKSVRRFHHDCYGGFLSSRAVPSRFDSWRGVHILWGREHAQALNAIRARLEAPSDEGSTKTGGFEELTS